MLIVKYQKKFHKKIIQACAAALKTGKIIAYPTDTCYGLAVDATNFLAIKKLYKTKGRNFNKPVHIIPPNIAYAKKIVLWDNAANRLAKKFFPGPLTLVLGLRAKGLGYRMLSAKSSWLGIRMPKNQIALDLSKTLKKPITTTSANLSGMSDCYSAEEVFNQFKKQKFKPDIILDQGKLLKRKPSTVVKIYGQKAEVLRQGPISTKQILKALK